MAGPPSAPPLFTPIFPRLKASLAPGVKSRSWSGTVTASRIWHIPKRGWTLDESRGLARRGRERPSTVPICCLFGLERCEVFDHASEKRRPFCVSSRRKGPMSHVPTPGQWSIWYLGWIVPSDQDLTQRLRLQSLLNSLINNLLCTSLLHCSWI